MALDRTLQDLAAHYQVHPNQISQWKKQAIEGLDGVFDRAHTGLSLSKQCKILNISRSSLYY